MFDDWKGTTKEKRTRAKRIAQTEGNLLTNIGIQRAFEKEERVAGKMWISAKDGKVREEHILNDSKVVDKGTAFPNGEEYPSQHSINCRCTIAPVIRQ
jgi:SPP1 gp7 family putative phage head morphogenesis protein